MSQQPEPLRLADALDNEFVSGRISNHTGRQAADELRRLYTLVADAYPLMVEAKDHAIKLERINAQLLEALDEMCAEFRVLDLPYGSKAYHKAHAAIAAAKENQ